MTPTDPPLHTQVVEIKLTPERARIIRTAQASFFRLLMLLNLSPDEILYLLHDMIQTIEEGLGLVSSSVVPAPKAESPSTPIPIQGGGNA